MSFADRLYKLSANEASQAFPSPYLRTKSTSALNVLTNADIQNDLQGRIVIITALNLRGDPGAGQNYTLLSLELLPPNQAQPSPAAWIKTIGAAGAASTAGNIDWQGEIPLLPGWWVRAHGDWNSGVATNLMRLAVHGYSIPLGNLAQAM